MKFEWFFNEEDFKESQEFTAEDDIFGNICVITDKKKYLIDIHKEYYSEKEKGYDLEIYYENEDGGHGLWLDSLRGINSSVSLERFKKRAEKIIKKFIMEEEAI